MTAEEFFQRRNAQPSPVILDIRPSEIAADSKLDGAHNIPFEDLEDRLIQLPPFAHILIYSDQQNTDIEEAIKLLWENGFSEMKFADGGYESILPYFINITDSAKEHFTDYQSKNGALGFKIYIWGQDYTLESITNEEELSSLQVIKDGEVLVYVDPKTFRTLEGTTLDYQDGKLTLDHPRMHEPRLEGTLEERIQKLIDQDINPSLAGHGGYVKVVDIQGDKLLLELGGGCQGCGMANVTLKNGIEVIILDKIPEITEVVDATDHNNGSNPYYNPT